jgi:hypothetical protein
LSILSKQTLLSLSEAITIMQSGSMKTALLTAIPRDGAGDAAVHKLSSFGITETIPAGACEKQIFCWSAIRNWRLIAK